MPVKVPLVGGNGRLPDKPSQMSLAYAADPLVGRALVLGAKLFYYANEKPVGALGQTKLDTEARESAAMRETVNRLCQHADVQKKNLMVLMDQINGSQRAKGPKAGKLRPVKRPSNRPYYFYPFARLPASATIAFSNSRPRTRPRERKNV